jgi:hypothetical protein
MERKSITPRERLQRVLRRRSQLRRQIVTGKKANEAVPKIESLTRAIEALAKELSFEIEG